MSMMDDRLKYYESKGITFGFLYHSYNLMRIPFERPHITRKDSLDYYIYNVRQLYHNIMVAVQDGDNEYFSQGALKDFDSMFPGDWQERLKDLESFIEKYNSRLRRVIDEQKTKRC